ncbi:hypothetical protein M7I_8023 [Glarea lozoyensis 74030]|uniref:Carrier domain-containing protein n=1 Tax=Glarea lozoyensis (strain ATCC 74030 / MF5533) TaxID=1104152 RepID=H0EYW2_GLAL7|nr:hypothetical protein M7I_8023 [Glarea lozoyensis 74030]
MVPSLVDELGETPAVLAKFAPSKFICASGGKHPGSIVDYLTSLVLISLFALQVPIWRIVERANVLSVHKNQLQRDYIAFAEPDKPFIRTDKGTVKRRATLMLYDGFIERFYDSRSEDIDVVTVNTTSLDSITESISKIIGALVPAVHKASLDTDMFSLGLDSLQVFRAIKNIRAATGLQDQLAPRHIYANPTINKFSAALDHLLNQARETNGTTLDGASDTDATRMKRMIDQHKRRQPIKMNPFDQVNFNHYMGLNFFFALPKNVEFREVFTGLQDGLRRAMDLLPALEGKIMMCSDLEIGYKRGDLYVSIPPLQPRATCESESKASLSTPRQLVYKDLSNVLPSYEALRDAGFMHRTLKDELLLTGYAFPQLPADILIAQANFVQGGCIVAANFHHGCVDGIGVMTALRVWAECCRYLQGDATATCSWLDPESFNHSLPQILYEQEGYARPVNEVDPGVWGFLPFLRPDESPEILTNGTKNSQSTVPGKEKALPPAPVFTLIYYKLSSGVLQ